MKLEYRGFCICLIEAELLRTAELVEVSTGTLLPTKIVAAPEESLRDLTRRARRLVDIYAGDRPEVRAV